MGDSGVYNEKYVLLDLSLKKSTFPMAFMSFCARTNLLSHKDIYTVVARFKVL